MQPLERVARAHREQLSHCAERLGALAHDLNGPPLLARVSELRDAHHELDAVVLAHLDAAEVTIPPLLEQLDGDGERASALSAGHADCAGSSPCWATQLDTPKVGRTTRARSTCSNRCCASRTCSRRISSRRSAVSRNSKSG